jgi:hypothetical protein
MWENPSRPGNRSSNPEEEAELLSNRVQRKSPVPNSFVSVAAYLAKAVSILLWGVAASFAILATIIYSVSYWHPSLVRLLVQSWQNLIDSLGTKTLGYLVAEIFLPVIVFLVTFAVVVYQSGREERARAIKTSLIAAAAVTAATVCFWSAMFGFSLVRTVYGKHVETGNFKSERDSAQNERDKLKQENQTLIECRII